MRINQNYQKVANTLSFLGLLIVSAMANLMPLNGKTTGELWNRFPNQFVPSETILFIWGFIHLYLAVFVIYQAKDMFDLFPENPQYIRQIGGWFCIAAMLNALWIIAWHYGQLLLCLITMIILLGCLIEVYLRLEIGKRAESKQVKYFVHIPISLYTGWITVGTVSNITVFLVHLGWDRMGFSEDFWAKVIVLICTILVLESLLIRDDIFFSSVFLTAYSGIIVKHLIIPHASSNQLTTTVVIGMLAIMVGIVVRFPRWRRY